MARRQKSSEQLDGWFPSSPISLNAGTGWGSTAPSAETKEANSGTESTHAREFQAHYLTTSGLFEKPPRPTTWREEVLESIPVATPEPSELVNEFRSALLQPESKEGTQPRKIRKAIIALGILLAAAFATIYLYRPSKTKADFQTTKTWMAKQWTSDLQEISEVFHSQTAARENSESNRGHGLSAPLRDRQLANPGISLAPASLQETQPNENVTPFVLYITDSYGRRWILTPTGEAVGSVDYLSDPSAPKAGALPTAPGGCRSPFYRPECP